MKIRTNVDKPKKGEKKPETSRDSKKYTEFREKDKSGRGDRVGRGASSDFGGVAPRVGSDQKKTMVMVKKPSRVVSGVAPLKKKKGMSVKMGMSAKGKGY